MLINRLAGIYFGLGLLLITSLLLPTFLHFNIDSFSLLYHSQFYQKAFIFSLKNALISLAISLLLGSFIGIILSKFSAKISRFIYIIGSLGMVLPTIIVIFGWQRLFHYRSELTMLLHDYFAISDNFFYGSGGIILIYVYYNLPLVIITISIRLEQIPSNYFRLASQLGFDKKDYFIYLYWPVIKKSLANIAFLVFLVCFQDFSITNILGGRPSQTSLPVFIYQALIYNNELNLAAVATGLQILPSLGYLFFLSRQKYRKKPFTASEVKQAYLPVYHHPLFYKILEILVLILLVGFMLLPLWNSALNTLNIIQQGRFISLAKELISYPGFLTSIILSTKIAISSGILACLCAYFHIKISLNRPLINIFPWLLLILPPLSLALGCFFILYKFENLAVLQNWQILASLNCLIYYPILVYFWYEPVVGINRQYDKLVKTLGLNLWQKIIYIEWPALGKIFLLGFSIVATLALGDLTIILFFGSPFETLTIIHQNLTSHYRFDLTIILQIVFFMLIGLFFLPVLMWQLFNFIIIRSGVRSS
ncbi:MAG: ABC transporter permease subunit [SAR324 cluster bacterium]|nr:ABC transporter permease subunit [SAR324 cluster bacterium]